jgi:hypothetical protein
MIRWAEQESRSIRQLIDGYRFWLKNVKERDHL